MLRWISVAIALGGLGCAANPSGADSSVERSADVDADLRARPHQRGTVIGGERVVRAVQWPAAERLDLATRDRLAPAARDAIARAPVPVLAIRDHADTQVFVGDHWAAATSHGPGWTAHVRASGQARVYPHVRAVEPTHPVRGGEGFVTRNEEIWSVAWIEHGVAYAFDLECDRRIVSWCDDEAAVAKLVDELVLVGGEGVSP